MAGHAFASARQPNLVVAITDDQTLESLRPGVMPRAIRLLGDRGVTFSNFYGQPICCPARAVLLTGQYPHNNGVRANRPGYPELRGKRNTLPVWLRRAGYRTAMIGKFLNGYVESAGREPAPGFDRWFHTLDLRYWGTEVSAGGDLITLPDRGRRFYLTNVLTRRAIRFTEDGPDRKPFFLWLSYSAPHAGQGRRPPQCPRESPVPLRSAFGRFDDEPLPMPPSYNEADVGDKPYFVANMPPIDATTEAIIRDSYRCALASLDTVDRGIARLVRSLRRDGELSRTVIVLTDDNGFSYGLHRWVLDKRLAYEEHVNVPLVVRVPKALRDGAPAGRGTAKPASGVDLAPTLLGLAGADPCRGARRCRTLDGRSLEPLLRGNPSALPGNRGILVEFARHTRVPVGFFPCRYAAVRTPTALYSDYLRLPDQATNRCVSGDEEELYDLDTDPFELENLLADPLSPALVLRRRALARRLAALRDCAGIAGRDPVPPSGHHCE